MVCCADSVPVETSNLYHLHTVNKTLKGDVPAQTALPIDQSEQTAPPGCLFQSRVNHGEAQVQ